MTRPTAGEELTRVQLKLHDNEAIWPRTELLRHFNDGYRQLLAESRAVRRIVPLDVPGRHTYAVTQDWEDAYVARGTVRKPVLATKAEHFQATGLWEVEALAGVTPTACLSGYTQEWERAYLPGGVDQHFTFTFPHNHERVVRLEFEQHRLYPVSVRELDEGDTNWMAQIGQPRWWTTGTGRIRSVELYEVSSTYLQAYNLRDPDSGTPRAFTGTRTWAVSSELSDVPYGTVRAVSSSERQYLPIYSDATPGLLQGRVADWRSSTDSVFAIEVVVPDLPLAEDDIPALMPRALQKYLRFFVLARAFGRAGEGRNPVMADHYARRFQRGVDIFRRLGDIAHKDRVFQRQFPGDGERQVARVRLPPNYPAAAW